MNKFKTLCLASSLLVGFGTAHANGACDGFELKIKNHLPDDFLVTSVKLNGGRLQPTVLEKLKGNSDEVFTVNNSSSEHSMAGEIKLQTISLPSKNVTIKFTLENKGLYCEHTNDIAGGDYPVSSTRLPGGVNYDIN